MFGYVTVLKDELKFKDYAAYRAIYCGVCTACGRKLSQSAKLGLSYDAAFAALVLMSVTGEEIKIEKRRCLANPFKKRQYLVSKSIDYAASVWALLAYFNFYDDWRDNKSLKALVGMALFYRAKRKVSDEFPNLSEKIGCKIRKLSELENNNCTDIDLPAAVSGEMLALCLSPSYIDDENIRQLREIGKNLGRWIYLMDAVDDFEKDKKLGNYNPLVLNFADSEEAADKSYEHMTFTLSQLALSYELLDIKANKPILDNIIYYGLSSRQYEIFKRKEKTNESI